jgi:hypothetical protein
MVAGCRKKKQQSRKASGTKSGTKIRLASRDSYTHLIMPALMNVYINTSRNAFRHGDPNRRRVGAARSVKLFLATNASGIISDEMVPDYMINDSIIDRYLAIEPPQQRSTTDFDMIVEEIERSYVLGFFFSALSASVVTIERMLNTARIQLHPHCSPKIKELWDKGPTNDWQPNIDALVKWKYISDDLSKELGLLFDVRCQYLHTGDLSTVVDDSLRAVNAAYRLLTLLSGYKLNRISWLEMSSKLVWEL